MTAVNPNNGNETILYIFYETYSNLIPFFIGPKTLKCFNNFYKLHIPTSLRKQKLK